MKLKDYELGTRITSFQNIFDYMNSSLKQTRIFITKEDHEFFTKYSPPIEDTLSGKLFLIEENDINKHHVFFDDNILEKESYIVDTWDVKTKSRISFLNSNNVFLAKVDLIQAICDKNYFIKKLIGCLKNRANKLGIKLCDLYLIETEKC